MNNPFSISLVTRRVAELAADFAALVIGLDDLRLLVLLLDEEVRRLVLRDDDDEPVTFFATDVPTE